MVTAGYWFSATPPPFWLLSQLKQVSFAGDVPTQTIALAMAILLVIVFGVSFLVEKTIDLFWGCWGWGRS